MRNGILSGTICVIVSLAIPIAFSQEKAEPTKQVFGPRGIMDTSPVIEVPVVEEEPIDHATIDASPLDQRLVKYDFLVGDVRRAGEPTPYHKGQLIGNLNTSSARETKFIPFIWIEPEGGKGKRLARNNRSSNQLYYELELEGDKSGQAVWTTRTIPVSPGGLYKFRFYAYSSDENGVLTAGTDFARRIWKNFSQRPQADAHPDRTAPLLSTLPTRRSLLFLVPEGKYELQVHVGPGKEGANYEIVDLYVEPVFPIYHGIPSSTHMDVNVLAGTSSFVGLPGGLPQNTENRAGDFLRLGDGEQIQGGQYRFRGVFSEQNGYFHRPILSTTAKFDTDRLILAEGDELIYRFVLQPIRVDEKPGNHIPPALVFRKGKTQITLCDVNDGTLSLDWSIDGTNWRTSKRQLDESINTVETDFDAEEANELFIRLKNIGIEPFAVSGIFLDVNIDTTEYDGEGKTVIATLRKSDDFHKPIEGCHTIPLMFSSDHALYKLHINESESDQAFSCGYMDYFGAEDKPGMHGDGPGKWTVMTFGTRWQTVRPHHAQIKAWAYNWFHGTNSFFFRYPGFSFSYEIVTPETQTDGNEEQ